MYNLISGESIINAADLLRISELRTDRIPLLPDIKQDSSEKGNRKEKNERRNRRQKAARRRS